VSRTEQPITPAELLAKVGGRVVHGPRPDTFQQAKDRISEAYDSAKAQQLLQDAASEKYALALAEARDHIESLRAQVGMMAEIIDRLTAQEEEEAGPKRRSL
jgi:F0F1-type ATP synthase membrane subunit b/b'